MSYTITRECLGILLLRIILLTAVIVNWSNADTAITLSSSTGTWSTTDTAITLPSSGINVCDACNSNHELIYSCCEGWSQGVQDNDECPSPVCDPPCDHGDCTSPDVCTCSSGFIGETCGIVSDKEYDSRLLHGTQSDRGIVQVRSTTGEWSLVNPDNWMRMNSHVLCRQLGFSFAMTQTTGRWQFPEDLSPTLGVRFDCSGDEESLQNCDVTDLPQLEVQQNLLALQCGNGDPDRSSHTCGSKCSQDTVSRAGCKCDPLCKSYRDCCSDFSINTNCPDATSIINVEETCTVIPLFRSGGQIPAHVQLGYFVVSTCSDSYQWDGDYINKMCEGETDLTDPVTFTPVQYTPTPGLRSTVYRNLYCAVCNQPDLLDPQQLEYVEVWKLETVDDFVIIGVRPPSLTDAPRSCYYMDADIEPMVCEFHVQIRENCLANYAPIFVKGKAYRNIFCAVCDNVYPENRSIQLQLPLVADRPDKPDGYCYRPTTSKPYSTSGPVRPPPPVADLFTLFDISGDRGRQCQPGQIFDHFQQMCRIFSCSTGYRLDDEGTCKLIPVTEQPVFDEGLGGNDTLGCVQTVLLESVFGNNTYSPTVVPEPALEITAYRNVLVVMVNDHTLSMVVINTLEAAMLQVSTNSTTYVNHVTSPLCNASILVVTIISELNDSDASNNTAHNVCSRNVVEFGVLTVKIDNRTHENIFQSDGIVRMTSEYIWRADKGGYFLNVTTVVCRPGNEVCKEIKFGPDEYSFIVNSSSVLHEASGKILLEGEYRDGENDTIHVCNSLLYNSNYYGPNKLENALLWISFVFFILSLIATFATFLSYCVFRELRNITGQITMNFLFAFFVAQLMFILAPSLLISKDLCTSSAIINHFAWLGGFFWMNALSLVTTKTLTRKTLTRKTVLLNKSNGMRLLAPYAAYAWGGPVLIVAVCVTLHFCDCTTIAPIYGVKNGAICWLVGHDGFASLWGFVAPVGVLLLFNTVLFIYAVVHFRLTISSARSTKKSKRLTLEATIYIKLTILMGLPWLLGFLQIFVTNIVLNYIYTILNSLQGVFVFMALVVTGRAGKLWRRKVCHGRSTISSASGKSKLYMKSTVETNTTSFTSSVSKTDPPKNGYGESSESRDRSPVQSVSVGVTNDDRESSEGRVTSPVVEAINAGVANDYGESSGGPFTNPVQSISVGVANDSSESSGDRATSPAAESINARVANDSSESFEDRATSPMQSISADVTNDRVTVIT